VPPTICFLNYDKKKDPWHLNSKIILACIMTLFLCGTAEAAPTVADSAPSPPSPIRHWCWNGSNTSYHKSDLNFDIEHARRDNTFLFYSAEKRNSEGLSMPISDSAIPETNQTAGGAIIHVASEAELMSALAGATAGETILLSAGDYGALRLSGLTHSSNVTIQSESVEQPAVFSSIDISSSSHLVIANVAVSFVPNEATMRWVPAIQITGSSDIAIDGSRITGGMAVNGVSPEAKAGQLDNTGNVLGLPTGNAITISNSNHVSVSSNDISQFATGITVNNIDNLSVTNNNIHDLRTTPLHGAQVSNVVIDGNHFYNLHPWQLGGTGDHADFIHFWTNPSTQEAPSQNIKIINNFLDQGDGGAVLGIYLDDNQNGIGYKNVDILNNVLFNGNFQGVRLENVDGAVINNNTMIQSNGDTKDGPTIVLTDGTEQVEINNNILSQAVSVRDDAGLSSTITLADNLIVQMHDPSGANYVGDLFVNPLAGASATLDDLQAVPGGLVAQLGIGSSLTEYKPSTTAPSGVIGDKGGTALDLLHHVFDVSDIHVLDEAPDLTGASVVWDFGDGSEPNSAGAHSYAHAGTYNVTATVSLADGERIELAKTIEVQTPVALLADFDHGAEDLSDVVNPVSVGDQVTFEAHGDGEAVRLNGDLITYAHLPEFFNNSEYTVLADFKKDAGHENDAGRLINFSGSFVVNVGANDLSVAVTTDHGTVWLRAKDVGIANTDWHNLAVTFSGVSGTTALYLDGHEIAHADGLGGAIQVGMGSQSLSLGDPWGQGFTGLIDNLAFVKGVLPPDEITSGNFATLSNLDTSDRNDSPPATAARPEGATVVPATPNVINGTQGNDHINGTDGTDDIHGQAGKDQIFAGGGDDVVHLGDQNWGSAEGGAGNDTLYGGAANDVLSGGEGNDILYGGAEADKLSGGAGDDTLVGGTGSDHLHGDTGNDILISGDDSSWLDGGDGNDILIGGASSDILVGGAGDDVLIGDGGKDNLTGGTGADKFVFGPDSGPDHLLDFNPQEDTLVLQGLSFQSVDQVLEGAFDDKGSLVVPLDGSDASFSWSSSDYISLVGVHLDDLTNANVSLVA
jgi:Ca2+-binding RTX toxin-like protein